MVDPIIVEGKGASDSTLGLVLDDDDDNDGVVDAEDLFQRIHEISLTPTGTELETMPTPS